MFNLLMIFVFIIDWMSISGHLQSSLSRTGLQFSPINEQALLISQLVVRSRIACAAACHLTAPCRIFDYDDQSERCRLFEGDLSTMGSLVSVASGHSRVGSIKLSEEQFSSEGQPCSFCQGNPFLMCINSTCQCPLHTYFDGSVCQAQKLLGANCLNTTECRTDLNYTCLPRRQCGPVSLQSGVTVGGYENGTWGNALNALNSPTGLGRDLYGSIYVADLGNSRVMKLEEGSLTGSIVAGTSVSGSSNSQLSGPTGLIVDTSLNIYTADSGNFRVMLWPKNASVGIRVAGNGVDGTTLNSFSYIFAIVIDSQGNMYISDCYNHRVIKWRLNATSASLFAGTGIAGNTSEQLNLPYGLYLDEYNGYLYIADTQNYRIQRYHLNNTINGITVAGGNGLGSESNQLNDASGVYVSKKTGAIYIADMGNNRIQRWDSSATSGVTIAGLTGLTGFDPTLFNGPTNVILNDNETFLYVADCFNNRIQRFMLI